jgi:hypothetical protein
VVVVEKDEPAGGVKAAAESHVAKRARPAAP